jgi:hypothetical protein
VTLKGSILKLTPLLLVDTHATLGRGLAVGSPLLSATSFFRVL